MAKDFHHLHKFHLSVRSISTEQKITFAGEAPKIVLEKHKILTTKSTEKSNRRRSQNFIRNLFYSKIKSKSKNQEKQKTNNAYDNKRVELENNTVHISQIMPTPSVVHQQTLENQVDLKSKPKLNGEFKPKGILKQASKTYSFPGLSSDSWSSYNAHQRKQSHFENSQTTNSKENSNNFASASNVHDNSCSKLNTCTSVKSVTFTDSLCQSNYRSSKSTPSVITLPDGQCEDLPNLHLTNTIKRNSNGENSIDSLEFQALRFCEPSENTT
ncbi:unnamed protein product [Rotaria socialis]|uniref:Uncharacterized protein n=1 Tax=Rotaria socialis TaxID=392032 RepID=A0A818YRH2_9BILA|nr:unnamed protein product [Rotaria socialis]CAF4618882.1 unnamed protein product [Rotaria socialis]